MEKFCAGIAKKISASQGHDDQQEQVITYGLIAMLQLTLLLIVATIIGAMFHFVYESILICLGVGFLRKSTGGTHSSTMLGCMIMSTINIALLAFISRYAVMLPILRTHYYIAYFVVYSLCYYIIYRYVPLDSPNKRITSEAKIARLRKQSFTKLACFFVASFVLTVLSTKAIRFQCLANSICLLTLWQCFTVTPLGACLIESLDRLFSKAD